MLNRGYAFRSQISSKDDGHNVLEHLTTVYPHSNAEAWRAHLSRGEVSINGAHAGGDEVLRAGDLLVWHRRPWDEPDAPQQFEVLYEDAHLLAVNKPGGLPTLPGGGYLENTLLHLVRKRFPDANPVHRLGRATTGIVLFARTAQAARSMTAEWNTSRVSKHYRALAQGIAAQDTYEILTPIGLQPHPLLGLVWAASVNGKASKSVATVVERNSSRTLFEVSLHTGRPQQIRIHLASIGHPLWGDPLYGTGGLPLAQNPGLPGDGGYLLHAHTLKFEHPATGKTLQVEAALPPGLAVKG